MRLTTLCYIEQDGAYLMLHRTKKEHDQSHDKWLGVGGKFEDGESPEECMLREAYEETGLTLSEYDFRGIVTFVSDEWETEYMHLFTAELPGAESAVNGDAEESETKQNLSSVEKSTHGKGAAVGETKMKLRDCDEGILEWVPKEKVCDLNLWEGDRLFLNRLNGDKEFFSLKLVYEGDRLTDWIFYR